MTAGTSLTTPRLVAPGFGWTALTMLSLGLEPDAVDNRSARRTPERTLMTKTPDQRSAVARAAADRTTKPLTQDPERQEKLARKIELGLAGDERQSGRRTNVRGKRRSR